MESPPQQEEVRDTDKGEGSGGRWRQVCANSKVSGCQGDMRPSGTAEDLQGADRQEHQDAAVEDRQGGARRDIATDMLSCKVYADIHWHSTCGGGAVEARGCGQNRGQPLPQDHEDRQRRPERGHPQHHDEH